ncbi:MAG TPA: type IV secretory system conjugative DNA transfer family protein [Acidimicrobiales bacterium]|nr:type IV secretory system conjugative DNA transfer family protein [Acidimicrobiales bacterium]
MTLDGPAHVGVALVALAALSVWGRRDMPTRLSAGGRRYRPDDARWARASDLASLTLRRGPQPGRLVLGRAGRRLVAAERGHSVLVVGPTQSYKTTGFAVPALLEWQGPVLAASVKTDLASTTMSWRSRCGTVWVYDPTASTTLPRAAWSPLLAATDWAGARRVSHSLVEAARPAAGSLADADFWYASAAKLLAPLLLAAATSGRTMADVVRWIDEQEQMEVAEALFCAGEPLALQAARASWGRDDRQRSAVYTTAETVVDAFAELHDSLDVEAPAVDPSALLGAANTLYLCAPAHEQRRVRPLFSALATAVLDGAFAAANRAGRPLEPPLLVVLDEAANVAPLAELDTLASTAAGHGVQLVTVWQDLAQMHARYGARAGSVLNNHRVKVFLSGIADLATLEHASGLVGAAEHRQRTTATDGRGARTTTEAPVVRPLLPPDRLRRLRPGSAVAVSGHLPPIRLRLRPWWREPDLRRRVAPG